jgi:hypothetical protein
VRTKDANCEKTGLLSDRRKSPTTQPRALAHVRYTTWLGSKLSSDRKL